MAHGPQHVMNVVQLLVSPRGEGVDVPHQLPAVLDENREVRLRLPGRGHQLVEPAPGLERDWNETRHQHDQRDRCEKHRHLQGR